jgi:hypothetical protein
MELKKENKDSKWESSILRQLYSQPGHEGILVPAMFNPPILLSNIQRLGMVLKNRGYTTGPDRRMGGWHMKLLAPGIEFCQGTQIAR